VVGFAESVALTRSLGRSGYGRYVTAQTLFTLLFLLVNLGAQQASVGRLSKALAKGDRADVGPALATFLKAYGLMAAALLLLGGFAARPLAWLLDPDPGTSAEIARLSWVLCFTAPAQAGLNFAVVVLLSLRRMKELAFLEVVAEIGRALLLVALLVAGFGVEGAVWGSVLGLAAGSLWGIAVYRRVRREAEFPRFREIVRAIPNARVVELLRTSLLLAGSKNMQVLKDLFPKVVLRRFWGEEALAFLELGLKVTGYPLRAVQGAVRNVLPKLAEVRVAYGPRELRKTFWKITVYSTVLVAAATALLLVLLPTVLVPIAYGAAWAPVVEVVAILSAGLLVAGASIAIEPYYIVTEQVSKAFRINLVIPILLALPAGWLAARFGTLGAAGAVSLFQIVPLFHLVRIGIRLRRAEARAGEAATPVSWASMPPETGPDSRRDLPPDLG
jgi:O-antigen/teichoic acid export membrane protein